MQIVITLNSAEELNQFLKTMKYTETEQNTAKAEQNTAKAELKEELPFVPDMPAPEPQMSSASATTGPAPAKTVTRQEVQAKAIALMDAGKQQQLQALLMKYNVPALPSIQDDQLAAFYADLEVL